MKPINLRKFFLIFIIAALGLAACTPAEQHAEKIEPAVIEHVGSEDHIVLTDDAIARIGLEEVEVVEANVEQNRVVGGQVIAGEASGAANLGADSALVRVALALTDLDQVNRSQPARVFAMDDEAGEGWEATAIDDIEDSDLFEDDDLNAEFEGALYYTVAGVESGLQTGQSVMVQLAMMSAEGSRLIVPYASVIYGLNGETWVYVRVAPRTYARHMVTVDYIEGEEAVLSEGPAVGTPIVTSGSAELLGVENGIGVGSGGH